MFILRGQKGNLAHTCDQLIGFKIEQQEGCLPILKIVTPKKEAEAILAFTQVELFDEETSLYRGRITQCRTSFDQDLAELVCTPDVSFNPRDVVGLKTSFDTIIPHALSRYIEDELREAMPQYDCVPGLIEFDRVKQLFYWSDLGLNEPIIDLTACASIDNLVQNWRQKPLVGVQFSISLAHHVSQISVVDIGAALQRQGVDSIETLTGAELRQEWPREGDWLQQGRIYVAASSLTPTAEAKVEPVLVQKTDNIQMLITKESYHPELTLAVQHKQVCNEVVIGELHNLQVEDVEYAPIKPITFHVDPSAFSHEEDATWSLERFYDRGDVVSAQNQWYRCVRANQGRPPEHYSLYWQRENQPAQAPASSYFFTGKTGQTIIRTALAKAWCVIAQSNRGRRLCVDVTYERGKSLTLGNSVMLRGSEFPNGKIVGKIVRYELAGYGLARSCRIEIMIPLLQETPLMVMFEKFLQTPIPEMITKVAQATENKDFSSHKAAKTTTEITIKNQAASQLSYLNDALPKTRAAARSCSIPSTSLHFKFGSFDRSHVDIEHALSEILSF